MVISRLCGLFLLLALVASVFSDISEGDDTLNVVTFKTANSTIRISKTPGFDIGHSGNISLEFKTLQDDGVLFHSKGPTDFIKFSIIGGYKFELQYQAGSELLHVELLPNYPLSVNRWHSVSVENMGTEVRIQLNGGTVIEFRETLEPVRPLNLSPELAIGATSDHQDGFVGCIRALSFNGIPVDLKSYAQKNLYGIAPGCDEQCESSPCLNNGVCYESYNKFTCNCHQSAFKGTICADEIGVNLRSDSMIKYEFPGSGRSTIAENIRIGFTTTAYQKGFLLGLSSNITGEYLTISVENVGVLKVAFDFGFGRQEISFLGVHFGLGQFHDVRFLRRDSGSTVVLSVDNYEPREFRFNIKDSVDAQFNNITHMYIGQDESMTDGFVGFKGCVSRVEFDDIFPLKLLFQQNPPSNIQSRGDAIFTEDSCGVEPVTHSSIESETRSTSSTSDQGHSVEVARSAGPGFPLKIFRLMPEIV